MPHICVMMHLDPNLDRSQLKHGEKDNVEYSYI